MSFLRPKPPWFNRSLNAKLARKRRIKAKGLAPVPATKAEQRALADQFDDEPMDETPAFFPEREPIADED